jgi:hypothetical protein
MYYNYKGFYSVVLIALVDADYQFIWLWADVGGTGSASDAQIYNDSDLREWAEDGTIGFTDPDPIPNDYQGALLQPPGLTNDGCFNYRLSRARHPGKPIPGSAEYHAESPLHRQGRRQSMHGPAQPDEDPVPRTPDPAARPCREY